MRLGDDEALDLDLWRFAKFRTTPGTYFAWYDRRRVKRARRRAARPPTFSAEQLKYGARVAIGYFLKNDPLQNHPATP